MKTFYKEIGVSDPSIEFTDTLPAGFAVITDAEELKTLLMQLYEQRERDGQDFYNGFRSELSLGVMDGSILAADAFAVEQHLEDIANNLRTGNWLTAQSLSTVKPLSGIYDQALKDEIQAGIDAYVTANY